MLVCLKSCQLTWPLQTILFSKCWSGELQHGTARHLLFSFGTSTLSCSQEHQEVISPMPQICSKQRRGKASFALAISGKQLELSANCKRRLRPTAATFRVVYAVAFEIFRALQSVGNAGFGALLLSLTVTFPSGRWQCCSDYIKKRLPQNVKKFESKSWRL